MDDIGIDGCQCTSVFHLTAAFESTFALVSLIGCICQSGCHGGITAMDERHVFYGGTGYFSDRRIAIQVATDDFGEAPANWIINTAGAASGDRKRLAACRPGARTRRHKDGSGQSHGEFFECFHESVTVTLV